MKGKGLFLALAVSLFCTEIDANAAMLLGDRSCGQWMQAHQSSESSVASVATEAWLAGYLSGLASMSGKDFLADTDAASLFLWVTNYCSAHPLDYLDVAGTDLAMELLRRKGR